MSIVNNSISNNINLNKIINFKTNHYNEALLDILNGVKNWQLWTSIAISEVKRRYRRTVIGPFWTTLSLALYIFSMGIVFSYLWKTNIKDFLPYFTSGIICWTLLSTIITEGCSVFIVSESLLKQISLPYSTFPCLVVARNIFVLLHHAVLYALIAIIMGVTIKYNILLLIPGLLLIAISGICVSTILGIICSRYRDVLPVINIFLQILMFMTPIFWRPEQMLGIRFKLLVGFNPLYHYINIIRAPLLGQSTQLISWGIAFAWTLLLVIIGFYMFSKYRRRLVFWI